MKLKTGPVVGTPIRSASQPHWKTATTAPNDAATESRKPKAALRGTTIERKTSSNSSRARPTTITANGSSESLRRSETSIAAAVEPVTRTSESVRSARAGVAARMSRTSPTVSSARGPALGTTVTIAVRPSVAVWGALTDSTSGRPRSSMPRATVPAAAPGSAPSVCTSTSSRPLRPGPKASEMRSYALRWVDSGAAVPLSGMASDSWAAGRAIAPRPMTTATTVTRGRRVTSRAQRSPPVLRCPSCVARSLRSVREPDRGRSRAPAKPSRAGSSVTATRTDSRTVPAAARPMTLRKGMPTTVSPHRATITVRPAKTTALPAVPVARPADSSGSMPDASWVRCLDRMSNA
ncbi:hypothetical protein BC342_05040 [Streptomyces olivaceus]|nr:hypothetical protein BC342_05040 [Streptomyces olivaceus]